MITRKLYLYFPKSETEKPIVYQLVKDFNLIINIFRAKVTPQEEGYLLLEVSGEEQDFEDAVRYLQSFNVEINKGIKGFVWHEDKCVSCGNCLTHCPTNALHISDLKTRKVMHDETRCIECMACLTHCPFGACSSLF